MIDLRGLCLQAGEFRLRDVSLHVPAGEYFVLMGQTGSGKSLLVKGICGLRRLSGGRVRIDGRDVTDLEPRDRQVGYMPQDCGLFPHLDVLSNIIFSLRARGVRREHAIRQVGALVDVLGLGHLLERSCRGLSGGESQKVALARALAGRPKVLLLDEPVSALDEPTRRDVCRDLRRIQRHLGISTIHVCHSLQEAGGVSDRVGILHQGQLHQTGPIDQLRAAPATPAVARLMNVETANAAAEAQISASSIEPSTRRAEEKKQG